MKAIDVLICDDSAVIRVTLRHIINSEPGLRVIDVARNGEEAIEKAIRLEPDVILLSLDLPVVDGLTVLKDIVRLKIAPVVILSPYRSEEARSTIEAIEAGAFDFILKVDERDLKEQHSSAIIQKLKQAAASNIYQKILPLQSPIDTKDKSWFLSSSSPKSFNTGGKGFKVVIIGLSTGGPHSIFKVLPQLPRNLNAAVIVVQHMPPAFISPFTYRLNKKTALECVESQMGMKLFPHKIYIARGGYHLKLCECSGSEICFLETRKPNHTFMPSVDITMHSVCDIFGPDTIGVLMTGMGQDGAEAMARISELGGITIAESEETAIAFNMPQEAIRRGGARYIVPNWAIADRIVEAVQECHQPSAEKVNG
jgi:two-component system, chemotaxis family, protein-glutamate methylesterase/glutaminase